MYYFAFVLLALSMLCALAGAAWAVKSLWPRTAPAAGKASRRTSVPGLGFVEKANLCLTGCYIIASAILIYALASYDFSLVYVASYTDRLLPLFYRITAFWAGQAGSMLFWAFSVAICGGLFQLTRSYKSLTPDTRLWYWVFYLGIMSFFGLILVTWNNPFLMNHAVPQDGNGLNPLLQNPGMIFHPPLLFLGYGGFVIPSCLALAQALSRRQADEAAWTDVARPFTLAAWAMLTAGIVLGGWWAYMELGWGGYWAWDPVENASLIPWLIATAALHTMLIQTRRNKLHGVNVFLMALTTISAFFATYLVRSGVVQSVHAFGSGGVGVPLLLFILKHADDPRRLKLSVVQLCKHLLRHLAIQFLREILQRNVLAYNRIQRRIISDPGDQQSLGLPSALRRIALVLHSAAGTGNRSGDSRLGSISYDHLAQIIGTDHIFFGNGLQIILPLQIFRKFAQFLCDLPVELRPLFRITLIVLFTQDTDLEVETVLRLIDSLLKSLFPQILDKFIRVLIRTHIDDFTGKPGLPENTDAPECRLGSGTVAVVGQQDVFRITV